MLYHCFIKFYNNLNLASSIGSSLSRVSSSSPSSTPTDSDSHAGPQVLSSSHSNAYSLAPSSHNSADNDNDEIAPPIASRPERTKSIVSHDCHYNCLFY